MDYKADLVGIMNRVALDAGPIAVLLDVHERSLRLDPRDEFVKSLRGMRARSNDEIVTWHFDEAVRVADSGDIDGNKLCGLGLFDVRDFLAETEFDSQLSALLI